jgi:DNA-binding response OmpR family regulator
MSKDKQGCPIEPFKILIVDSNIVHYLERGLVEEGIKRKCLLTAESGTEARKLFKKHTPSVAVLGYMLPDANGVELGAEFSRAEPGTVIVVMSGTTLPPEELEICEEYNFPILRKPFSVGELLAAIRKR